MPFDGMPDGLLSDLAKLCVALDGVRERWTDGSLGLNGDNHCALGWLLVATDWDEDEATRLALKYVWPALPEKARGLSCGRIESIYRYNDGGGQGRVEKLFANAVALAERD